MFLFRHFTQTPHGSLTKLATGGCRQQQAEQIRAVIPVDPVQLIMLTMKRHVPCCIFPSTELPDWF